MWALVKQKDKTKIVDPLPPPHPLSSLSPPAGDTTFPFFLLPSQM